MEKIQIYFLSILFFKIVAFVIPITATIKIYSGM